MITNKTKQKENRVLSKKLKFVKQHYEFYLTFIKFNFFYHLDV